MKFRTLVSSLLMILVMFSVAAAQEGVEEAMALTPDVANGKEIFAVCAACHQLEAWGTADGTIPQLAGQSYQVAIKQLMDIRALNRDNPTMHPFTIPETVGGMQNLVDVSAYITGLPMSPDHGKGPWEQGTPEYARGKELYEANCVDCHMDDGAGQADKFYPLIQGQHFAYMVRQFEWIRDGKRRNANPEMVQIVQSFSDEDVQHVVNYVSWIPVPREKLAPASSLIGTAIQ